MAKKQAKTKEALESKKGKEEEAVKKKVLCCQHCDFRENNQNRGSGWCRETNAYVKRKQPTCASFKKRRVRGTHTEDVTAVEPMAPAPEEFDETKEDYVPSKPKKQKAPDVQE